MGNFTIELNAERAPLTVAQFFALRRSRVTTPTLFFIASSPSFVIQGGGFDADYNAKPAPD